MLLEFRQTHAKLFIQHSILILFFAVLYYFAHQYILNFNNNNGGLLNPNIDNIDSDVKPISFFDCVRFSLITQTTVGYGSLVPTHTLTKAINVIQLLTIYGVIIINFF